MNSFSQLGSSTLASALLLGGATMAVAAAEGPVDVGKSEYRAACAVCHGVAGKGDGPASSALKGKIPDLTVLARNNQGVFPFDRVYQVIDGRQEVPAHGPREMPIWGQSFNLQSSRYFTNYPLTDNESAARSRIMALTEYVYRLQAR